MCDAEFTTNSDVLPGRFRDGETQQGRALGDEAMGLFCILLVCVTVYFPNPSSAHTWMLGSTRSEAYMCSASGVGTLHEARLRSTFRPRCTQLSAGGRSQGRPVTSAAFTPESAMAPNVDPMRLAPSTSEQLHTSNNKTRCDLTGALHNGILGSVHVETTHASKGWNDTHGDRTLDGEGSSGSTGVARKHDSFAGILQKIKFRPYHLRTGRRCGIVSLDDAMATRDRPRAQLPSIDTIIVKIP
ncbi:hypothetical protein AC579_201 [Pseudocercospora musae]|uniref:Uncharacterized protein n=1 Tax=Pseudocercospora musae TaxID=113226 RepID=A0A139HYU3_9PEZI|nr:hypothetical protein AC579_201 [Pseudocercospora musae]